MNLLPRRNREYPPDIIPVDPETVLLDYPDPELEAKLAVITGTARYLGQETVRVERQRQLGHTMRGVECLLTLADFDGHWLTLAHVRRLLPAACRNMPVLYNLVAKGVVAVGHTTAAAGHASRVDAVQRVFMIGDYDDVCDYIFKWIARVRNVRRHAIRKALREGTTTPEALGMGAEDIPQGMSTKITHELGITKYKYTPLTAENIARFCNYIREHGPVLRKNIPPDIIPGHPACLSLQKYAPDLYAKGYLVRAGRAGYAWFGPPDYVVTPEEVPPPSAAKTDMGRW